MIPSAEVATEFFNTIGQEQSFALADSSAALTDEQVPGAAACVNEVTIRDGTVTLIGNLQAI